MFAVAIWGAYLIRTMLMTALGMITFWTTRVSAIFELFIAFELLLSGRLVPLELMPDWAEKLAYFLPFMWTFYFPIHGARRRLLDCRASRRARGAGRLDDRADRLSSASSGATRCGSTRRWATDARPPPRLALLPRRLDERAAVPRELRPPDPAVRRRRRDGARRARRHLRTDGRPERVGRIRAAGRARHPDPARRCDRDDHSAEHAAADGGGARREARLRADEAGGLAGARQRARRAHLARRRHHRRRGRARVRHRRARRGRRRGRRTPLRRAPGRRGTDDLLLLARPLDARVLDRERLGDRRALRGHLPDRPLPGLDLSRPGCASASRSSSRSRLRSPCLRRPSRPGSAGGRSRSRSGSPWCSSSSRAAGGASGSGSTPAPRPSLQCCAS